MPRVVGSAPSNIERLDALAPTPASDLGVADRAAVFEKEQAFMADFFRDVLGAECQVALQNFEGARANLDVAIFLRLGAVFISPQDACLGDRQQRSPNSLGRSRSSPRDAGGHVRIGANASSLTIACAAAEGGAIGPQAHPR